MSNFRDFLRKRVGIGQKIKAFSFFDNDDYVRLEDHKDVVLSRAAYPKLSAVYPTGRFGQAQRTDLQNPLPSNTWELFGDTHAMSDDGLHMITASTGYDGSGTDSGKAMIYRWESGAWVLEYTGNYGSAGQKIGIRVEMSRDGSRVAITRLKTVGGFASAGSVRILRRSGTTWLWDQDIDHPAPAGGDRFGWDISFDKHANTIAIGAYLQVYTNPSVGQVWIYERSGTTWSMKQTITSPTNITGAFFGKSLKLSADGNTLLVTAEGATSNGTTLNGIIVVYDRIQGQNFFKQQELAPPRELSASGNYYGSKQFGMSADGSVLAVGVRYATRYDYSNRDGGVIIYKRSRNAANSHANQNPIAFDTLSSKDQRNRYPYGQYNIHQMIAGPRHNDTEENFGNVVALSGDGSTLLSGSYVVDQYFDETMNKFVDVGGVLVYKLDENAEGIEKGVYKKYEYITLPPEYLSSSFQYFANAYVSIDYFGDKFLLGHENYDGAFTNQGLLCTYSYIDESGTDLRFPQQRYGKNDICTFVKVK